MSAKSPLDLLPPIDDAMVERFLREEVGPTYDAYMADPSRCVPMDEVFDRVEAWLKAREAKAK